ncbi:hypothetical protein IQ249_17505 [Lusitaniella coriacea LEGE 07157]|uniref:Uncharacterized protein n=1 Tax=Lusitaniella coriacea LEGE 07157 TaxID=945747 RepID=A0A8J7DYA5_9CYAN|nr:DUF6193 family natural product biosynthesis protein [Lusitaniella coriacea]MBE9117696.1 hypothetical protein [Lusitaniella coriacea LEGE 07157]
MESFLVLNYDLSSLRKEYKDFIGSEDGKAHEQGEYVEFVWKKLLLCQPEDFSSPELFSLIHAASLVPELRSLIPYTSMLSLRFKCKTDDLDWNDYPCCLAMRNGEYSVQIYKQAILMTITKSKNINDVIKALVQALPKSCGDATDDMSKA